MLRLCDVRRKIVDKVNAIKNHRKNSESDFYYIYSGTKKRGMREQKTLSLITLKK